jgi:hypothetical protein
MEIVMQLVKHNIYTYIYIYIYICLSLSVCVCVCVCVCMCVYFLTIQNPRLVVWLEC